MRHGWMPSPRSSLVPIGPIPAVLPADSRQTYEGTLAIARNLVIDHHRRDRPQLVDVVDERVLPAAPGPEERFAGSPELLAALSELPQRDLEVLALRFGGDLDGPEIASILELSVANVQQIQSRSLRKLRALLTEGTIGPATAPRRPRARLP